MRTPNTFFVLLVAFVAGPYLALCQLDQNLGGHQIRISKMIETAVVAEPLDGKVNSQYLEYGPTFTKDGERLYFSRQYHPANTGGKDDEDIWFSEFDDATQSWKEAINMGWPLNNNGPNFICGVGVDGDTLLLGNVYGKKGRMKAGLSISIRAGDTWSFPIPVSIENDYNMDFRTSFDLSTDRKVLLIAQKKTDSRGGLDLYVAFRKEDHRNPYSGTESVNIGPVINSVGDETSPFLAFDNRTLYFASNGHNGYGKLDIFVSRRLDETWTNWSEPENLGPGINTAYDDAFFGFTPRGRYAYYSRGLTPSNSDLYRVDMTYLFKSQGRPIDELHEEIDEAQIGQSLVLDSVFADNSSVIKASAIPHLDYVVGYMKVFKNYKIMINAHSNLHASREESQVLSMQRAVNILNYLLEHDIPRNRLEYQGYGHDVIINMDHLPTLKTMQKRIISSAEFRLIGFVNK
jgi:flagellar motor protein MotB